MKKALISLAILLLTLGYCLPALPWAGEHPAGQPVWARNWPAGLRELLNGPGRVYGYFINADDFYFYSGDTEAFNEFLEKYAKLKDTPLILFLHSPKGKTAGLEYQEKKVQFDWEVKVLARRRSREAPPDPTTTKPGYVVALDVWLGGEIALDKLKIPLNVKVRSGEKSEEFSKFIAAHEAKRKEAEEEDK